MSFSDGDFGATQGAIKGQGLSWFLGPGMDTLWGLTVNATGALWNTGGQIRCVRFAMRRGATVNKLALNVATAQASSHVGIAIYSEDGQNKHLDSGPIDTSSTGVKTATLGAAVLLPDFCEYWLAWGCDNSSVILNNLALATGLSSFVNSNGVKEAIAGNSYSSGMPPSLGTLTTATNSPVPAVLFEV